MTSTIGPSQGFLKAKKALVLLTAVNYFNYIDRFILAAVLGSIKLDLNISDLQAGLLATAFMIPYVFTAPLFGWLGDTKNRAKILSWGIALWSVSTILAGYSPNFNSLMASRFFLGIGESAFTTLSVSYLCDYFSKEKQGWALALFSSALPLGAALGFILGGLLSSKFGWRSGFVFVGAPGLVLAFLIGRLGDQRVNDAVTINFKAALRALFSLSSYRWTVLGYCAYAFAVGGVAHWSPVFIERTFQLTQLQANLWFGAITVAGGLIGTFSGAWLGDWFEKKKTGGYLSVCSLSMFLALPLFFLCINASDIYTFAILLFLVQTLFFISTSPINVGILQIVPKVYQNMGMAFLIFGSHVLGDSISPPLIGQISDRSGSLKMGLLVCVPVIFLSGLFWEKGRRNFVTEG